MKLAAQMFTVRDYCQSPADVFATLKRIKEMGYDGVELERTLVKGIDRKALAEVLAEQKLAVCSIRNPFSRTCADLEGMIEDARAWGCDYVGIGTITGSYGFNTQDGFRQFAREAKEVGSELEAHGLHGLYALYSHEFVRDADGRWGYDVLEEEWNGSNIVFETDTFRLTRAGLYPTEIFDRLRGRMPVVRFRDQRPTHGEVHFFFPVRENCPVGDGLFDFEEFMVSLHKAQTQWITLGQEYCTQDPFVCLERSLKAVRKLQD